MGPLSGCVSMRNERMPRTSASRAASRSNAAATPPHEALAHDQPVHRHIRPFGGPAALLDPVVGRFAVEDEGGVGGRRTVDAHDASVAAQQVAPDRLRRGIAVLPLVNTLTGQCRAPLGDEFDDGLQIGLGCGENHHVPEYSFEGRN